MKLCKEDKLGIYDLVKSGKPYLEVSREFQVHKTVVQYLVYLLDIHGPSILEKKGKDYYPPKLKQEMIHQVDKDYKIKHAIQEIYDTHKGNYGYRRITPELRNRGFIVNHKKVRRKRQSYVMLMA